MNLVILFICGLVCFAAAKPEPTAEQRIVGGVATTTEKYPFSAALLYSPLGTTATLAHICGAVIVSNRAFLTAAHCIAYPNYPDFYRVRIGSTNANARGTVTIVNNFVIHENYTAFTRNSDIAIIIARNTFSYTNSIRNAVLASYIVAAEEVVFGVGYGDTTLGISNGDDLREVQLWTVANEECTTRYTAGGITLDDNMICAGWLNFGGRGTCLTDEGGPLVHNGIVIGIKSFSIRCADPTYPGVYTDISSFFTWIQANI